MRNAAGSLTNLFLVDANASEGFYLKESQVLVWLRWKHRLRSHFSIANKGSAAVATIHQFLNFLVHLYLPQRRNLVTEILCHHQTMYAAVHDADAHTPEVSLQDVGAMSGRAH